MTQSEAPVGAPIAASESLPTGWCVHARHAVGSTNDEARAMARAGAAEGTLFWALSQTAGRGRRGRDWESPEGNLYVSVILRPPFGESVGSRASNARAVSTGAMLRVHSAQASFVAAIAVAGCVRSLLPATACVQVKWPNDVLVDGAKVAGLLLEAEPEADGQVPWLVIGMGVNLRHAPVQAQYPATSLVAAGAAVITAEAALPRLAAHLARALADWRSEGFAGIRTRWREQAVGLDAPVTVRLAHETREGIFRDLDADGALLLEAADGTQQRITAGDVFFSVPSCSSSASPCATEAPGSSQGAEVSVSLPATVEAKRCC